MIYLCVIIIFVDTLRSVIFIKLAIFDLDGTLVNSIADLACATNTALEKFGYPVHEVVKYNYMVGDGVPKLIERALPPDGRKKENNAIIHKEFDKYYKMHYSDMTRPYSGIPELLQNIKRKDILIAVASNKPDKFTKAIVSSFFDGVFDVVQGKADDTEKKPAPDIILKIIKKLDVSKEDTIMIGDSNVDIFTAQNAGVRSIGCLWGFRTKEELEAAKADYIVSEPCEILNLI